MSGFTLTNFDTNRCTTFSKKELNIIELALTGLEDLNRRAGDNHMADKCADLWERINSVEE